MIINDLKLKILITHFYEFHRFRDSIFHCQMTITGKVNVYYNTVLSHSNLIRCYTPSVNHILNNIRKDDFDCFCQYPSIF